MMQQQSYNPSPAEIRQACAEIRSTWTPAERLTAMQRTPPLLKADFVLVQALAEIRLEDRLARQRDQATGFA